MSNNNHGRSVPRKSGASDASPSRLAVEPMPPLEQVLRQRRILITGGTGFLGKVLLYLLLRWHPEIGRIFLLIRGDQHSSLNRFRREILDSPALGPLRDHLG
ncbi:MAG: SDR family oxidoreductase, partial [Candidatus Binataceae bacterium]